MKNMRVLGPASLLAAIVAQANAFAVSRKTISPAFTRSSHVHHAASQLEQLASMTVLLDDFNSKILSILFVAGLSC